jgi:hypothetical protein
MLALLCSALPAPLPKQLLVLVLVAVKRARQPLRLNRLQRTPEILSRLPLLRQAKVQ